jgi:acetate kinase
VQVLVLNCGSSSVKFQLQAADPESDGAGRVLARGIVSDAGGTAVVECSRTDGARVRDSAPFFDHRKAVEEALAALARPEIGAIRSPEDVEAVGHRVVHGGERFRSSVRIDDEVLRGIEDCFELAPLHNPPNVRGIRAARALLPGVPQVAVFDTSFHHTMPAHAFMYGIPYALYERHGIRRYGFHGTSHRYLTLRLAALLGREKDDPALRLITCHLGNGCSVSAIRGGRSLDTSMGFTPLEGLLMGTRSGDMDPAIVPFVMQKEQLGPREIESLLNKHSGLYGVSGVSNDMRALLEAEKGGLDRARLAVDLFCYRVKKYVAAFVGVLGGVDALAFAGGIGENSAEVRRRCLTELDGLGLAIDPERNGDGSGERDISPGGARTRVFVVPTDEEWLIARDTLRIVRSGSAE